MNVQGQLPISDNHGEARVFISYATANRKGALSVCEELERRGQSCWISTRDVPPGENYQEAIVRAIRGARAMVLIFSEAANHSDEIKKELSLASRHSVPVIAVRMENVEPSDAFAYELSTRQWIDAFDRKSKAMETLSQRLTELPSAATAPSTASEVRPRPFPVSKTASWSIAGVLALLIAALLGWRTFLPQGPSTHDMTVRLAGFRLLSPDLPPTLRDAVDAEIAAAFNADGVVGVSTASVPPRGTAAAYSLGGTIQRNGPSIRVITRLTNERSGATLWTNTFDYDGKEAAAVPRHIAVDSGNVVRCGLFGASTYRKPLPDAVLTDYLQFCQGHWDPNLNEGRKALIPAQRVVAAAPDFSWGWAGVAGAYWKVAFSADNPDQARALGRQAADRAIALDGRNSEALYIKAVLTDRLDWLAKESLFKRAIGARRLDCGCEHHQYGSMLLSVGRVAEAVDQFRQANDMLALYVYTPLSLADALIVAGQPEEAKHFFDTAIGLAPNAEFADRLARRAAAETGDIDGLLKSRPPSAVNAALAEAYRAKRSGNSGEKQKALRSLLAVPEGQQNVELTWLLADLGAEQEAFRVAARIALDGESTPSLFWHPAMRPVLLDPSFPKLAQQLGLLNYWKMSRTRPDVCRSKDPPPFCRLI